MNSILKNFGDDMVLVQLKAGLRKLDNPKLTKEQKVPIKAWVDECKAEARARGLIKAAPAQKSPPPVTPDLVTSTKE